MPTETPAQYSARVASNAAKTGAPMPVQNRSNIPSPAQKPMVLPPMVTLHKQTTNPALPSRINQNTPAVPSIGNPAPARPLGPMTNTPNQVR
jgi:hypothetical protein